jgi:hypothetical protein
MKVYSSLFLIVVATFALIFIIVNAPITGYAQEVEFRLFEDFSGEIVNGSKHFGFTWAPSEGNETLVFDQGKILFSNGTVLLS